MSSRFYISTFFCSLLMFFSLIGSLSIYMTFHPDIYPGSKLVAFQQNKIQLSDKVDGVFLGDSSLGNSVDVRYLEQISGLKALNLALSESYGFAGDLNLFKAYLAKDHPRFAIFMHTAFTLTKPVSYLGDILTSDLSFFKMLFLKIRSGPQYLKALIRAYHSFLNIPLAKLLASGKKNSWEEFKAHDYLAQGPAVEGISSLRIKPGPIELGKKRYLTEIMKLCRRYKVSCYYAFGPLYIDVFQRHLPVINASKAFVEGIGFELWPQTFKLENQDLGDSIDHPNYMSKQRITFAMADKLKEMFAPAK